MAERGVRFIQLYHRGWDQHYNLPTNLRLQCQDVDRPCAALIADLKRRGLLDDTLVVWGGEFGRTTYSQGTLTATRTSAATIIPAASPCGWPAAAFGRESPTARPTTTATTSASDGVHVHDLNATLLHCLGVDHTRLTFKFQGRYYRLTDVEGKVVDKLLV